MKKTTILATVALFAVVVAASRMSVGSTQAHTAFETAMPLELMQATRDLPAESFDAI
ncbi:MAG: hypothetical protein QOF19_2461 [Alphaproteobacteria bacterium]|jgi:hypothetical protein|nr:hypothetical protein [Alphaproteobacteria bacterium]MEA2993936.1 hypothetical protein [Alphaproteobacteria bacterium]